jgi:hypothetical protein
MNMNAAWKPPRGVDAVYLDCVGPVGSEFGSEFVAVFDNAQPSMVSNPYAFLSMQE